MQLEYIVTENDINKTVREIILSKLNISHRLLTRLKKENCIFLNNSPIYVDKTVSSNDVITVSLDYKEDNSNIASKNIPLDIIYEDDWLLVVNKQAGIPVHPSINHYEDNLSCGVKFYFDTINLKKKIRPVNRIDKDTSGLVVFAKCEYIQEALIKQMNDGRFYKEYIAICEGHFDEKKGTIKARISRKDASIIERCIDENGEKAITHYEVLKEISLPVNLVNKNIQPEEKPFAKIISVIKCILETGKTHQIRVHMSYIGHPLLGDDLYGGNLELIKRQALHSYKISFIHPVENKKMNFEAKIPNDIKSIINLI